MKKEFAFTFDVLFTGKPSDMFFKKVGSLITNKLNVDMNIYVKSFKVGNLFSLNVLHLWSSCQMSCTNFFACVIWQYPI